MAAAKPKLRVGMIGQGFMGRAHSNAFRQAGRFFNLPAEIECRVICGRNPVSLQTMADNWGWQQMTTDWRSLIGRKDIDAIDIAAPNVLHAPIAIAAAQAGKIVLCEKPLAVSASDARQMAEATRGQPSMVWFNYRRIPALAFAHRLIREGKLGRIFHYRACFLQQWGADPARSKAWKLNRDQAGSGVTGDLLSHVIDTALWLNGPIEKLSAMQKTFVPGRDVDDATLVMLQFQNASVGSLEATRFAIGHRNKQSLEIHGEKGMLRFDFSNFNSLEFLDATEPENLQGLRSILVTGPDHPYWENFWRPGHPLGYEHTFIAALADFVIALDAGTEFHPNFDDGSRVQLALDAVEASACDGLWRTPEA